MNLLYVSYCPPYSLAFNAGAQTLYYYINRIIENEQYKVDIVTYCEKKELEKISKEDNKINYHLVIRPEGLSRFIGRIISINSKYNPFHKYCNLMTTYSTNLLLSKLRILRENGYYPNIIFLEWTQIVLLIDVIKKIFPNSKIISSEPDVTFLSRQRKYINAINPFIKFYKKIQFQNCKKREIVALRKSDYIFTQNNKDVELILNEDRINRNKVGVQIPYYHRSKDEYNRVNNNILFFGAMNRTENSTAVVWFIENVMPLIEDLPCKFVVLGGGLDDSLKALQNKKIIMKGFVQSIDEDFSQSMCFVCPLILGAGIKVKVLEAMYSNIPVLTNDIGIEGIPALNGRDYIHCITPNEYADAIRYIYNNDKIQYYGRQIIEKEFSLDKSLDNYLKVINQIGGFYS